MKFVVETPADFSYEETINAHGWRRLAPFETDEEPLTLHRVLQSSQGDLMSVTMRETPGGIEVECSNNAFCNEIVRSVRIMFQLDISLDAFHEFCITDPILTTIPERKQGRMLCSPTVWEDCCKVILTTNTTWTQTVSMTKRLVDTYGSTCPEVGEKRSFPSPHQLAAEPFDLFHEKARFGYRSQSIHSLATQIASGQLDLETLRDASIDSADIWKRLIALRGVGPYAASCLMIYLGRYGRVNVDSWARMMVGRQLGREVTDKEVHSFFSAYGDWCGLVYHFYPWSVDEPSY